MPPRPILLIDDDRLQARITQAQFEAFRGSAFSLEWASSYENGLTRLLTGNYAACLLDFQLGERDGLSLLREAIARGCRTPIIFLTAESEGGIDLAALDAGAMDYLVKGEINPRALERSLRYALKLGETLDQLHRLATYDSLTGLLNRREFLHQLDAEIVRCQRFERGLSVVMLDIDHFKAINDTHGHPAGDAVLQVIAQRLASELRAVDRVARLGGEEFAVLLVETDSATALQVADRMLEAIVRSPLRLSATVQQTVTISAGIACLPAHGQSAPELLAAADAALYQAKRAGRARACVASEKLKA